MFYGFTYILKYHPYLSGDSGLPPDFAESIQYLTDIYQGDDGKWYQADARGDGDGDVKLGKFVSGDGLTNYLLLNEDIVLYFNKEWEIEINVGALTPRDYDCFFGYRTSSKSSRLQNYTAYMSLVSDLNQTGSYTKLSTTKNSTVFLSCDSFGNITISTASVIETNTFSVEDTITIGSLLSWGGLVNRIMDTDFIQFKISQEGQSLLDLDFEDYEAGTTGTLIFKDKSGQGNDVTLQGVVDADTIQESVTVRSYTNEYGYNERMKFNGTSSGVKLDSVLAFGTSDWKHTGSFIFFTNISTQVLLGGTLTYWSLAIKNASRQWSIRNNAYTIYTGTLPSSLVDGKPYSFSIERVGTSVTLVINDVPQSVLTIDASSEFSVDLIGYRPALDFTISVLFDINLNGQASYLGYGTSDADWEDQIGTNNGTVTDGSSYLIQADLNNLGFDILGNPLVNDGRVRYDAELSSGVLVGDGITNRITLPTISKENPLLKIRGRFLGTGISRVGTLSGSNFYTGLNSTTSISYSIGNDAAAQSLKVPDANKLTDIVLSQDYFEFDGIRTTEGITPITSDILSFDLLARSLALGAYFELHSVQLYNNGVLNLSIDFTNNAGSEVFNKVTGLPLTIQGTIDEDTWQLSPYQRPSNILDGCDVWVKDGEPNKYVGFDLDGNSMQTEGDTDPDGYTWSYKTVGTSIGHNGAETTLTNKVSNQLYDVPLAVKFDGLTDSINTGIRLELTDSWEIETALSISTTTLNGTSLGLQGSSTGSVGLSIQNGTIISGIRSGMSVRAYATGIIQVGISKIKGVWDGVSEMKLYENDILSGTATLVAADGIDVGNVVIGNSAVFTGIAEHFNNGILFWKLIKNGTLVCDLIPIKQGDTLEGVTALADGMFDRVNKQILYSEGAGDLIAYNGLMYQFDGTPLAYNYDDIEFDFNSINYWFNDLTELPIKDKSVIYGTQQSGTKWNALVDYLAESRKIIDADGTDRIDADGTYRIEP